MQNKIILIQKDKTTVFDINPNQTLSIGTAEINDLVLDEADDSLAFMHCQILFDGRLYYLIDPDPRSRSQIRLNDKRVTFSQLLRPLDKLGLGNNGFELTIDFDPRPAINDKLQSEHDGFESKKSSSFLTSIFRYL